MGSEELRERVAVNSGNIADLRREQERTRERLHELESDRATLRLLVGQVKELSEQMPTLARRAAREAVDEYLRRRHADTFANLRTYAVIASVGIAFGALIVSLIFHYSH